MNTIDQHFGPETLTSRETEDMLRLSRDALRPLLSMHGGPIEARYLNGRIRICRRSLQAYLDNLTEQRS